MENKTTGNRLPNRPPSKTFTNPINQGWLKLFDEYPPPERIGVNKHWNNYSVVNVRDKLP